jgi:hypothetical protein
VRILCVGSQNWDHPESIRYCLDVFLGEARAIYEWLVVMHGCEPTGADQIVEEWCLESIRSRRPVRVERWPPKYSLFARRAEYLRDDDMVQAGADLCLAFIRDHSKRATRCAEAAERYEIPVRVIDYAVVTE